MSKATSLAVVTTIFLSALNLPTASAATIYLCKTYGGASFWSSGNCSKHNALISRIADVPDGIPFEQQVDLARQERDAAERLHAPPPPVNVQRSGTYTTTRTNTGECAALEARIQHLDALARNPLSGQAQERIREERKEARDRQFRIKCR